MPTLISILKIQIVRELRGFIREMEAFPDDASVWELRPGVTNSADPLGGSYLVESLTRKMEEGCLEYFDKIDNMGGMVAAIEAGFPQREIADAAYRYQQEIERHEKIIVGVNAYVADEEKPTDTLYIDEDVEEKQKASLAALRERRDGAKVDACLAALTEAAATDQNLMPLILESVQAYATLGEIVGSLRTVFGDYEEPATF